MQKKKSYKRPQYQGSEHGNMKRISILHRWLNNQRRKRRTNYSKTWPGWVARRLNEEEEIEEEQFCSKIKNWLSSTRTELEAIWIALLVAPANSKVGIHTDSKAAIQAIVRKQKTRKFR